MDFSFVPRVKISKRSRWRDSPLFSSFFFLFAFIAEHRQSKILTTRKKLWAIVKNQAVCWQQCPAGPAELFGTVGICPNQLWQKSGFWKRECIVLYYVHPFYNIDCLELKLLLPTKFKTVPLGLCPEASLNYDEGKLTRELALCAIRCGDLKKDSDFIK